MNRWPLVVGRWPKEALAVGRWLLAVGCWPLVVGRWPKEALGVSFNFI
jgi:hypothetical protein